MNTSEQVDDQRLDAYVALNAIARSLRTQDAISISGKARDRLKASGLITHSLAGINITSAGTQLLLRMRANLAREITIE